MRDDRFLQASCQLTHTWKPFKVRTIAFDHERFNHVVANHFEVGVANPVADGGLRAREEVVDDSDFVAKNHKAVHEMGANEACPASDEDALPLAGWEEPDRREAREGGVGDRVTLGVVDGLGLIKSRLVLALQVSAAAVDWWGVVRTQVERSEDVDRNLAVESKAFEADCLDLCAILI